MLALSKLVAGVILASSFFHIPVPKRIPVPVPRHFHLRRPKPALPDVDAPSLWNCYGHAAQPWIQSCINDEKLFI